VALATFGAYSSDLGKGLEAGCFDVDSEALEPYASNEAKEADMKRLFIILPLSVLLLSQAVPAAAVPPERVPLPPTEDFVDDETCPFPFLVQFQEKLTEKSFFDREGNITKIIVTGPLKVEMTRLDADESVVLNIPGPGITLFENGEPVLFKAVGPWVLFFGPGDLGEGHPGGLFLTRGRVVFDLVEGEVTRSGTIQSVCGLLS
jgi:hypothetical protein